MADIVNIVQGKVDRVVSGVAAGVQGNTGRTMARSEARQMMANAKAIEAAGIRESADMRLRGDIMISNAKAIQAASGSGGGASDIEMETLMTKNRDYNAAASVYSSQVKSNSMKAAAYGKWIEGDIMQREGRMGEKMAAMAVVL